MTYWIYQLIGVEENGDIYTLRNETFDWVKRGLRLDGKEAWIYEVGIDGRESPTLMFYWRRDLGWIMADTDMLKDLPEGKIPDCPMKADGEK